PPLVLEPARRAGHRQLVLGPASCQRLRRVERREVAADDLLGGVALDPLGPGVPGGDPPPGVEHEDSVVRRALDQQAQLLGLAVSRLPPGGRVSSRTTANSASRTRRTASGPEWASTRSWPRSARAARRGGRLAGSSTRRILAFSWQPASGREVFAMCHFSGT